MLFDVERDPKRETDGSFHVRLNCVCSFHVRLFGKGSFMKGRLLARVHRRDLLRLVTASAAAAATATSGPAEAEPASSAQKRRARYQANSTEVQEFYRVNRYPVR
jgi:hypothetical protein